MLYQNAISKVSSEADGTECIDHLVFRQFIQPVTQFVQRNVHCTRQCIEREFVRSTYIQQEIVFHLDIPQLSPIDGLYFPSYDVFGYVSCNGYRIFGRRERRGVSLLHFHQIIDRTFMLDDKRDFVNAFVYTVIADDLSAVQFTCLRVESDFNTHRHGIRVISCVRGRMDGRRHIIDFCLPQSFAG